MYFDRECKLSQVSVGGHKVPFDMRFETNPLKVLYICSIPSKDNISDDRVIYGQINSATFFSSREEELRKKNDGDQTRSGHPKSNSIKHCCHY